jgi:glycosyltransferase 2 family protein
MTYLKRIGTVVARHQGLLGLALVATFAAVFLVRGQATLLPIGGVVRHANPWWMLGAVAVELFAVWLVATKYRIIFDRLGHRVSGFFLFRLQLERAAVGTISPVGGAPSLYVFARGLQRRGVPIDDVLLATSLKGAAGIIPLITAVVVFAVIHFSSPIVLVGSSVVVGLVGALVALGLVAFRRSELPERWLGRAPKRARAIVERARGHGLRLRDLALPIGLSVLGRLAGIAVLYLCLRAVGQQPPPLTPIVASVVGSLAGRVVPIFRGLGVVEASMAGSLEHIGIPAAPALGAILLYRLASLWLPLVLGLLVQTVAANNVWSPPPGGSSPVAAAGDRGGHPRRVRALPVA